MRCDSTNERLTMESLASATDSSSELLDKFVAYGLIEPAQYNEGATWFDVGAIARIRMIGRLRRDLGINLAGIAVVFDLLARIEDLQRELTALRQAQYDQVDGLVQSPPDQEKV
jgi:hypothetical protein